jgi:hypothetical protein
VRFALGRIHAVPAGRVLSGARLGGCVVVTIGLSDQSVHIARGSAPVPRASFYIIRAAEWVVLASSTGNASGVHGHAMEMMTGSSPPGGVIRVSWATLR